MSDDIELGDEVECFITGLKGIACGRATYITGCDKIEVRPGVDKEGKMKEGYWMDVNCLKITKKKKIKMPAEKLEAQKKVGGPMVKVERRGP